MAGKSITREVKSPDEQIALKFLLEKDGVCKGMPYIHLANPEAHVMYNRNSTQDGIAMVETVHNNNERFTREQVTRAAEARDAMAMMGHPTEAKFKQHVVSSAHVVKNFNLT